MTKLWFKAKRYGWGWRPCSWEGWLVTAIFIIILIGTAPLIQQGEKQVWHYLGIVALCAAALIAIAYKTGEKPRWRWGN